MRAFLVVLDSVGIGAAPDADAYGDAGANTLAHTAAAAGGLDLPVLRAMGLGNIPGVLPAGELIQGVPAVSSPTASYGAMQEVSRGKDTTTGHWEMAGLQLKEGFHVFPQESPAFPEKLVREFERLTGRRIMGNRPASGTRIIAELGQVHMREGRWIVYTSADSVFQIAAHEDVIPLEELYRACGIARDLCDEYRVGRVIARPFVGEPGSFRRTDNRRDYSYPLPEPTVLDALVRTGIDVTTVGKLDDIFNHRGITRSIHVENNREAQVAAVQLARENITGLVFANLIDFDMRHGHRRDPEGYALALEQTDGFLGELAGLLDVGEPLLITADHGNDPTFAGTDHTREFVPLLAHVRGAVPRNLGIRAGFFDVAQSLASFFGLPPMKRGCSFL
ncbi:phosphopentomutase [Verrucomicrobiota bacterium]